MHTYVDFLSRHVPNTVEGGDSSKPQDDEDTEEESNALIIHQISGNDSLEQDETSEKAYKKAQEEDEVIEEVKNWMKIG